MPNTEQLLYQTDKTSHGRCSIKMAVLKNFASFTGEHLWWSSDVFLWICEIFKNTYFEEQLRTAASELTLEIDCLVSFWTVTFKTILAP